MEKMMFSKAYKSGKNFNLYSTYISNFDKSEDCCIYQNCCISVAKAHRSTVRVPNCMDAAEMK
jgi:hypothetical protein